MSLTNGDIFKTLEHVSSTFTLHASSLIPYMAAVQHTPYSKVLTSANLTLNTHTSHNTGHLTNRTCGSVRTSSPLPTKRKNHNTKTNLPSSARASHPFIFNTFNFNYLLIHPSNVTLVIIQTRNLDQYTLMFRSVLILIHGCQAKVTL